MFYNLVITKQEKSHERKVTYRRRRPEILSSKFLITIRPLLFFLFFSSSFFFFFFSFFWNLEMMRWGWWGSAQVDWSFNDLWKWELWVRRRKKCCRSESEFQANAKVIEWVWWIVLVEVRFGVWLGLGLGLDSVRKGLELVNVDSLS